MFKARKVIRDKDRHYIIMKGSVSKKVIIFDIPVLQNRVANYVRQKRMEPHGEILKSTTMVGDFNPLYHGQTDPEAESQQGHSGIKQHHQSAGCNG